MSADLPDFFKLLTFVERSMQAKSYAAGLATFSEQMAHFVPLLPWAFLACNPERIGMGSGNVAAVCAHAVERMTRLSPGLSAGDPKLLSEGISVDAPLLDLDDLALMPLMDMSELSGVLIYPRRLAVEDEQVYNCLERCLKILYVHFKSLNHCADREPLTQLLNRAAFMARLAETLRLSVRHEMGFCVGLLDIDHFKRVNDAHGHAGGDLVLSTLADFLRRTIRESDVCCRYGGDEFGIILPFANAEAGTFFGSRLLRELAKVEVGQMGAVTMSIGLVHVPGKQQVDLKLLMQQADKALYDAKDAGRNCVVVAEAKSVVENSPRDKPKK
jgi:diguanylate cyclase (GGDEF)-like protein